MPLDLRRQFYLPQPLPMFTEAPRNNASHVFYATLGLRKCGIRVQGIGAHTHTLANSSASLTILSIHSNFTLSFEALVIPTITSTTPAERIDTEQWRHLEGLKLADPHFGSPGIVDILVGADIWGHILEGQVIIGRQDEPHAQCTRLGWVIFGPASTNVMPGSMQSFHMQVNMSDVRLDELVQNFWKSEEVPSYEKCESDVCSRIFTNTHQRDASGRYMVHLPLSRPPSDLGDSYGAAVRQFQRLERKLASDKGLREKYVAFMTEYATLGHMELAEESKAGNKCYYIPHHAVTTKFRVVFNASARTTNGLSLNDLQIVGPSLQDVLVNIIFRFRRYSVALTADIEKMFRQILVTPEHRDLQRILWRDSPSAPLRSYRLTTITYGMASSPYNAIRSLIQCAHDNFDRVKDHPQGVSARDAILNSFYVDDLLLSCDDAAECELLADNINTILSAGHFKLRKWNSNDASVLEHFKNSPSSGSESIAGSTATTVLGLKWDPVSDELFYTLQLEADLARPTKRSVLSDVARLFDPTGLLAPVVVMGKIFLQRLWAAGLTWDESLPSELNEVWSKYREDLPAVNRLRISRWLGITRARPTSLYGFCDASTRAYAAVIYVKTTDDTGNSRIVLLTARTKVAPFKGSTIPRLELCAAQLLAKTLHNVQIALGFMDVQYYLWSDSRVVLCWLRKQPTTLKPYVANRVRQIQELTPPERWYHVRSADNPADCASRGITATELVKHPLWWGGPAWLRNETVPITTEISPCDNEMLTLQSEERVASLTVRANPSLSLTTRRPDGNSIALIARFSSIDRILRIVAYVLRWLPGSLQRRQRLLHTLELDKALELLIRIEQGNAFANDLPCIYNHSRLPSTSRLHSLNPYVDERGIIRVGSRISKAESSHDFRFPIILPKGGILTNLLVLQAHHATLHGGHQLTLQTLRARFWILNGRQAVRSCIHRCVICRRHRHATSTQQMAPLPEQRVKAARPFLYSGVDYCGPFILRIGTKRSRTTVKTYLAIFICMTTKAVHLEVVEDLSGQSFLDAFTRFVSRRGPVRDLYSDNGTAFIGANRLLKEDLAAWHSEYNQQTLAHLGTNWNFITPRAPHQGGLWEAAVKSAKRHLVRVIGAQPMWYSQMHTLATRIEACLNSRPLTPLYDDPEDKFALTPGDFLVGEPLIAVAEPSVLNIPINRLKHWQWLRQLHQQFWQRWSVEYLETLQARSKWYRKVSNMKLGDVVIVKHENLPPTHWRLGRVVELHPGSDGLVRNVTLKTSSGFCTRAVQKLCVLLDAENFESDDPTGQDV